MLTPLSSKRFPACETFCKKSLSSLHLFLKAPHVMMTWCGAHTRQQRAHCRRQAPSNPIDKAVGASSLFSPQTSQCSSAFCAAATALLPLDDFDCFGRLSDVSLSCFLFFFDLAGGLEDISELLSAPAAVPKDDGVIARFERRFMSGTQQRNAQQLMNRTATVI